MRALLMVFACWSGMPLAWGAEPDFTREVRPILARHCFKCHGPDDQKREANLRLDEFADATRLLDSGERAISPGHPDQSELIRRITTRDPDLQMPPASQKATLTEQERKVLTAWIAAGATYKPHWAFVLPQHPGAPVVAGTWARSDIDAFVLRQMQQHGLQPSPEASREALIRRWSLDLLGLPPTVEEIDTFLADESPDAAERLLDRLFSSPRYGERWTRKWLDLARYADTNGYEKDRPRSIWPYRDWVLQAINADMPFDQFTLEQLAGDLLPNATEAQRIATGLHRNTMTNEEGGIDPLEFRFYALCDRVHTTATTWMGMTFACAQCHTHKYDPLPHADFYGLMAFLDNSDEVKLPVPTPEIVQQRQERLASLQKLKAGLKDKTPLPAGVEPGAADAPQQRANHLEEQFQAWLAKQRAEAIDWEVATPITATSNLPRLMILDDGSVLASGDQTKRDEYAVTYHGDFTGVTGIRLEALPHPSLPKGGPGRAYYEGPEGDYLVSEFRTELNGAPLKFSAGFESYSKMWIGTASGAMLTLDGETHTGWATTGREGEAHAAYYQLPQPLGSASGELVVRMIFERHYSADLGRFRISVTRSTRPLSARVTTAEQEAALLKPAEQLTPAERESLLAVYLETVPELAAEREAIAKAKAAIPEFVTTLAFQERPADHPRPTHRRHRGEFLQPREVVEAHTPSFLSPFPTTLPRNREGLARWLMAPEHPLTARVTANRHWAALFGRGIVTTLEDFGLQGATPSHPELLDWLATELIRQEWSIKRLQRFMVSSATYRQAAQLRDKDAEIDPENVWLARGSRVRLDAEQVRDSILQTAGLLSDKLAGPSVFPPQPANVSSEGTYGQLAWKISEGEDRYRRGLYTFSKRTAPYAMLATFDGPSGEACVPRREVTNTALQALTLLNDAVALEGAEALGRRFAEGDGSVDDRIVQLWRECLGRVPEPVELARLRSALAAFESQVNSTPAVTESQATPEQRTWTLLARAILNLDEFVTKE